MNDGIQNLQQCLSVAVGKPVQPVPKLATQVDARILELASPAVFSSAASCHDCEDTGRERSGKPYFQIVALYGGTG